MQEPKPSVPSLLLFLIAGVSIGASGVCLSWLMFGDPSVLGFIKDYQTLIGAVIGSGAIGYHVSRGFKNQIEAQTHAAVVERDTQAHFAQIQTDSRRTAIREEAKCSQRLCGEN